ncbi:MAG: carboxypeptidase-like regulatory domain-containing protein [Mangrovibacterium sp.]|nr:carboxypeptidase-like regulatory domain-containing protein [Mangrovibacterium sp.]
MKAAFNCIVTLLFLSFLIASAEKDPKKNIRGKVIDETTQNPLYGVNVCVSDATSPLGTITNEKGEFRLWNIPVAMTELTVSLHGYKPANVTIKQLNDSSGVKLLIKLQPVSASARETLSHVNKKRKN